MGTPINSLPYPIVLAGQDPAWRPYSRSDFIEGINGFAVFMQTQESRKYPFYFLVDQEEHVGETHAIGEIREHRDQAVRSRLIVCGYAIRRIQCFERDKCACVECGSRMNLECHHKIERSKQRIDKLDNLQALCHNCHAGKHGQRIGSL